MRLYRTESMFELALRLTQNLKQDEYFLMRYKDSGEIYIDSMAILNTIHETLSELEPEDAYHDFRVENMKIEKDFHSSRDETVPTHLGSSVEQHRYDHYTFNGENYEVDWANLDDDDYREFGR